MFTKTKSSEPDLYFIKQLESSLNRIENEQVHQRKDLSVINALLKALISDIGVQKQVTEYFEEDEHIPEEKQDDNSGVGE